MIPFFTAISTGYLENVSGDDNLQENNMLHTTKV